MTLQTVNFGSASDGSQGDTARAAFGKLNANFTDTTNAASRLVGLASGNILEVGALGLGADALNYSGADLNNAPLGSYSRFEGTQANASTYNFPTVTTTTSSLVAFEAITFGQGGSASRTVQIASEVFGVSGGRGRTFVRVKHDTNWFPWRELAFNGAAATFTSMLLTSTLTLTGESAAAMVALNGAAGQFRYLSFRTAGSSRFDFGINPDAESGGNAGSSLVVSRYSDAGVYIDQPFRIDRATGETRLSRASSSGPFRPGQFTLASLPSASAFTGYEIDVTDAAGGAKRCRSDGTNWKILNTTTTVS
ncbi:hypothetical protein [Pseudomonas oryzihabitans]|uniref:hypothetical protein n=1 Tax=Pseudomonas oryzihabitans TaxID=47885 RepID=UPI003EB869C7